MTKPGHTCGAISALIRCIFCVIFLTLPLAAQSLSRLRLEESTDLQTWLSIAVSSGMIDAGGRLVLPTDSAERFYRLQVELVRPPSLGAQPAPATVTCGSNTTLSATASGTGPFTYQLSAVQSLRASTPRRWKL